MKVDVTDLSPVKKRMSIEVGADVMAKEAKTILRKYASRARIPGFRQGKAPLDMVRARFADELQEDIRERMVTRCYLEAAKERGLAPLGDPVLDEVSYEDGEPLRFQTTFEVLPEFELKGHRGVSVRQRKAEVTNEEVDKFLEELRQSRVQLISEEDTPAKTGHVLVADVEVQPGDKEPMSQDKAYLEVGTTNNLPAFNDAITGAKAGQDLEFSVDYPAEYPNPQFAGETVAYKLHIQEVKRKQVPDLDDEFAKDLGDFDGLDTLKAKIREDLEAKTKHQIEQEVREAVLGKVLLENPIALPDVLVEREVRFRLEQFIRTLVMQGIDPEKEELDWKRLYEEHNEPARRNVHAKLILDAVSRVESVEVTAKEIEERIQQDAQRSGQNPAELKQRLKKHSGMEALKNQLVREKSLDLLTSIANIQIEE